MVTWERVAELARELPEIEETTSWPQAYRLAPHFERSPGYLLIWLDFVEEAEVRERLIDAWLLQAPKRLAALHDFD